MMLDVLLPFGDLNSPMACNLVPPFLTKERLKLCWEQVSQIRSLLPQAYCRFHKTDRHAFDSHPLQYAIPLFYFTFKMAVQYREPSPSSHTLAAYALEKLSSWVALVESMPVLGF